MPCKDTWNEHKGGSAAVSGNHDNERLFRARSVPLSQGSQASQQAQLVRGEQAALQGRRPGAVPASGHGPSAGAQRDRRRIHRRSESNGGSIMRIYRDKRFSKDKSPYKTYAAAHFWHANGKDRTVP